MISEFMMKTVFVMVICFVLSAFVAGCTLRLNERAGLAGANLSALDVDDAQAHASFADEDESSLTNGHDRGHWREVTIAVPIHQVEHHPTYNRPIDLTNLSHRDTGVYPTAVAATRREPMTWGHLWETDFNALGFFWALLTSPWQMTAGGEPLLSAQGDVRFLTYERLKPYAPANLARWWAEAPDTASADQTEDSTNN